MIILQEDEYNRRLQESHWRHMPCSVWWFPKTDGGGINHHKFCIVDGQILWHGSFNFTWSAANRNQEEFTRDRNLASVTRFSEEFTRLRRVIDEENESARRCPDQTLGTMCVTRSAQTHRITPESTSATWNRVGTFGFLAPRSTWMTSAIHQTCDSSLPTITVIPALTCRKIGSDLGIVTPLA